MSDLRDTTFFFYCSGVYEGIIRFKDKAVMHAKVDSRRRTQMQENVLSKDAKYILPFQQILNAIDTYSEAEWAGDIVELRNGDRYEKHLQYRDGTLTSQVWAFRNGTALDVITLDGEVIAFLVPNRSGLEIIVKEGHEKLTPLVHYDDPKLSSADYGVNDLGTFLVPMRDGVRLATDVFLPEGVPLGSKLPAILVRSCYDRNRKRESLIRWVNKGYVVVSQDVRGRADSEGDLIPFYYERDDSSDTIDWIISQDWSDGNVGMWGASYLGYVVVSAATSGHPNLKAVVDEVNVGSPFTDTVRRGGAVCSWTLLSWTLAQSVGTRTDFDIFAGIKVNPEEVVDSRPIKDIPQKFIGKNSGPWDLWSKHPEYDDFWKNCTFSEKGENVKVPMFVISGWYDGDGPGVSETWRMLSEHDVPNRKIWLGPWEHGPNRARDYHGMSFSNDAVVYDYDIQILRWFDRFLKGIENGIEDEPRATYYLVGENKWMTSDDWTPIEAVETEFYLDSDGQANSSNGNGRLTLEPKEFTAKDSYIYNPEEPMEDSGERDPVNLRKHELRNDILVYTSPILEEDVAIAGELSAILYAASTGKDTDWVVSLSDVDEKGNAIRLSNYIFRAKYRNGFDAPEWLTPGKIEKYSIYMQSIAHTFKKGHRIRFSVTSSSKFIAFPNTNTGMDPYQDGEPIVVQQTVAHGIQHPSHVKLPVLYGSI